MALFIPEIPVGDFAAQAAVRERLANSIKEGDLGVLEPLALRLAAIRGQTTLDLTRKTVVLVAADHGHPHGNTAVTADRAQAIGGQSAPVNALARQAGAVVKVADVGMVSSPQTAGVVSVSAASGTKDMTQGAALGLPQVNDALLIGMNLASIEISTGLDLLVVGGVGSGRRLSALAIMHVLTERPLRELTADQEERELVQKAIEVNQPDRLDPLDVLRTVGGLDISALAGLILTGAAARVPLLLDDLASAAAALIAAHLSPAVRAYLLAGHRSGDSAHDIGLRALGLRPLLDLGVHQSAGCGGVLAVHIVEAAARVVNEMGS